MLPKVFQLVGLSHSDDEIRVGNEWYPYGTGVHVRGELAGAGAGAARDSCRCCWTCAPSRLRRIDGKVIALGIMAVTFLVLYLRSRRWIEAEPVFATLFCAFAWSRALPERVTEPLRRAPDAGPPDRHRRPGRRRAVPAARRLGRSSAGRRPHRARLHPVSGRRGAGWSRTRRRDARVFATDWDDFPELFFWNTHNTYLLGLDPTYMYLHDPQLYLRWRAITRGQVDLPGADHPRRLRLRAGSSPTWSTTRSFSKALADPDLQEVYRDRSTIIFAVRGWQPRT